MSGSHYLELSGRATIWMGEWMERMEGMEGIVGGAYAWYALLRTTGLVILARLYPPWKVSHRSH